MANTRYDQLTRYVLPEVQGCSEPLAEQAVRDALIEFCQRSMVWVYISDAQNVTAGTNTYDVELPSGASLVQIKNVQFNGQSLTPLSIEQLFNTDNNWMKDRGQPTSYTQIHSSEFILSPIPDTSIPSSLIAFLTLQPSRSSASFPDWINDKYQDTILYGAKSRLMLKPNCTWSNPQQAMLYKNMFDVGIASAKDSSILSFVRTALRTTSRH